MALNLIITNAGRAAIVNATNTGTAPVTISQFGVSASTAAVSAASTVLDGEIKRIGTLSGDVVANDTIHLIVRDETSDTYTMRSFALYLADGTLFAIYGQSSGVVSKSTAATMLLAVDIRFADISATSLTFGSTNFLNPPATTSRQGVVELATNAEAAAMVDIERAVVPANLAPLFAAAALLARILTVDGAGSSLDADLLDGQHGAYYLPASTYTAANVLSKLITVDGAGSNLDADLLDGLQAAAFALRGDNVLFRDITANRGDGTGVVFLNAAQDRYLHYNGTRYDMPVAPLYVAGAMAWTSGNDGAGSGLDADLLDGLQSVDFLRSSTTQDQSIFIRNTAPTLYFRDIDARGAMLHVNSGAFHVLRAEGADGTTITVLPNGTHPLVIDLTNGTASFGGAIYSVGQIVWNAGNDGAGSGLDADLLDGFQAAAFARLGQDVAFRDLTVNRGDGSGAIFFGNTGARYLYWDGSNFSFAGAPLYVNGYPVWTSGNDGAGSGLDADLLDGYDSSAFAKLTGAAFSGNIGFNVAGGEKQITFARAGGTAYLYGSTAAIGVFDTVLGHGWTFDLVTGDFNIRNARAWHAANDGAGSGLDADLLDGLQGASYVSKTGDHTMAGALTVPLLNTSSDGTGQNVRIGNDVWIGDIDVADTMSIRGISNPARGYIRFGNVSGEALGRDGAGQLNIGGQQLWHAGNDGTGSGLDADLLDGQDSSFFTNIIARLGFNPVRQGGGAYQGSNTVYIGWDGSRLRAQVDASDQGPMVFDNHIADVWRASNDGAGSGLDADLLDGWQRDDIRSWGNLLNIPGSLGGNGWMQMPNGLILQWGSYTASGNNYTSVNFPVSFPNVLFHVESSGTSHIDADAKDNFPAVVRNLSGTGSFTVYSATDASTPATFFAIGN